MRKYDLAIFDMDGTILDTLENLTDCTNYALDLSGYPHRTRKEVRSFVGNGRRKLVERAVPEGTPIESIDKVYNDFDDYFRLHSMDNTAPYDGILTLLENLRSKGIKTAVVSNKADYAVKELCDIHFNGLFDVMVGDREGIPQKPSPDSVIAVMKTLGVDKNRTVYIGDSDVDIMTARNAQLDMIITDWGFRDRDYLEKLGADIIVSDTKTLERLIIG